MISPASHLIATLKVRREVNASGGWLEKRNSREFMPMTTRASVSQQAFETHNCSTSVCSPNDRGCYVSTTQHIDSKDGTHWQVCSLSNVIDVEIIADDILVPSVLHA